jgi:hypothetical protein
MVDNIILPYTTVLQQTDSILILRYTTVLTLQYWHYWHYSIDTILILRYTTVLTLHYSIDTTVLTLLTLQYWHYFNIVLHYSIDTTILTLQLLYTTETPSTNRLTEELLTDRQTPDTRHQTPDTRHQTDDSLIISARDVKENFQASFGNRLVSCEPLGLFTSMLGLLWCLVT